MLIYNHHPHYPPLARLQPSPSPPVSVAQGIQLDVRVRRQTVYLLCEILETEGRAIARATTSVSLHCLFCCLVRICRSLIRISVLLPFTLMTSRIFLINQNLLYRLVTKVALHAPFLPSPLPCLPP